MIETTALMRAWQAGDRQAGEDLMQRIYPDLRRLSAQVLGQSSSAVELSDLVQELYLRLDAQRSRCWENRGQFFAIAARLIRRITLDHVKSLRRSKRGGNWTRVDLRSESLVDEGPQLDLVALDRAIDALAEIDPSAARIVELRFYGGLTVSETAAALEIGRASVVRRWRFAKSWLYRTLHSDGTVQPVG